MPQARTRNSRPASCNPSTEFPLRVGSEQDDPAVPLDGPEAQDLRGKRPICRGGKFVTATTCRPRRSSLRYHGRIAADDFLTPWEPKSILNLYDGLRASGNSSTPTIFPTRISTFWKSSTAIPVMVPNLAERSGPI